MRASLCSCSRTTHADDHQTYTGQLLYEWHGAVQNVSSKHINTGQNRHYK